MTGAEILKQTLDRLQEAHGWADAEGYAITASGFHRAAQRLDGCVLLTAPEIEEIARFVEFVLSSGMPDWDDVEAGEAKVLRLLGRPHLLALLTPSGKDT